jgi:hypothetical protein
MFGRRRLNADIIGAVPSAAAETEIVTLRRPATPVRSVSTCTEQELCAAQEEAEQFSSRQVSMAGDSDDAFDDISVESSSDSLSSDDDMPEGTVLLSRADVKVNRAPPVKAVFSKKRLIVSRLQPKEPADVDQYMARREMTEFQEKMNAVTILPNVFYCIYFCWAGLWLQQSLVNQTRVDMEAGKFVGNPNAAIWARDNAFVDANGCVVPSAVSWFFGDIPALPPLAVLAAAAGILLHAPWSFLYHWKFAHALPPGIARIEHWSRRMDHAFIHVASACASFATSGSWDYFLANLFFNLDCVYRQFKPKVRPTRNKIRIGISCLAYTIPVLRRGDVWLFLQLWIVFVISGWLFAKYPLGGWSHSMFHLVIGFIPPLLMVAACALPASQEQMKVAAQCLVLAEQQHLVVK